MALPISVCQRYLSKKQASIGSNELIHVIDSGNGIGDIPLYTVYKYWEDFLKKCRM